MLNPNLKLNEKLFDEDVVVEPTRAGFGSGLRTRLGCVGPNEARVEKKTNHETRRAARAGWYGS